MRDETSPSCLCPSFPGAMEADFLSSRRRESKEERSKPQFEYSSAAVHPSIRHSVFEGERRPKLSFWALRSISLSRSRDPLYLGGATFVVIGHT